MKPAAVAALAAATDRAPERHRKMSSARGFRRLLPQLVQELRVGGAVREGPLDEQWIPPLPGGGRGGRDAGLRPFPLGADVHQDGAGLKPGPGLKRAEVPGVAHAWPSPSNSTPSSSSTALATAASALAIAAGSTTAWATITVLPLNVAEGLPCRT